MLMQLINKTALFILLFGSP